MSEANGFIMSSEQAFEETFERSYRIRRCGKHTYRFRDLSGKEYLEWSNAECDKLTLVMLSVCDGDGVALFCEEDNGRERLSGPSFPGHELGLMWNAAAEHCFGEGINKKQEDIAGN